jgi:DNA-binding IclR family transcriptional regulator
MRATQASAPLEQERPGEGSGSPVSLTLKKGLAILSLFDSDHPNWTFGEIWRKAGLSRPTAFRLVKTLEEAKYLAYDPERGTYHLGVSILRGTYLMLSPAELSRIAHPFMERLTETTTETVVLAVWVDHEAVVVDRVPTPRPFKPDNPIGLAMPGLANIHTRIFLAFRPEEQARVLARPLEKRTPYTSTDPLALKAELAKIRRSGIAFGVQEWNVGMAAVGMPIFDAGSQVRASLAVVAPVERFGPDEQVAYADALRETATDISRALGFAGERLGPEDTTGHPSTTATQERAG